MVTLRTPGIMRKAKTAGGGPVSGDEHPEGVPMARQKRTQLHDMLHPWEDLLLLGGSEWRSGCTCGWNSRPCGSPGVALGLWRRHIMVAGRR